MDSVGDVDPARVDALLVRLKGGDQEAFEALMSIVYSELREIAHRHRVRWSGNETIGTTVLVHEAFLKLSTHGEQSWQHRAHFMGVASRAMRQVLIDYARARQANKRGGDFVHVSLDVAPELVGSLPKLSIQDSDSLLALDESLTRLEAESAQHSQIIECRFFGDMTIEETAEAIGVSPATVKRGWVRARAWLHRDMERADRD